MNPSFFPRPKLFEELESALGSSPGTILSSPPAFSTRTRFAYTMMGNCGAEPRTSYLSVLRKLIEVDEYGECAHSKTPFQDEERAFRSKIQNQAPSLSRHDVNAMAHYAVGRHYKFYFAFENTIAEGYVTEKLLLSPLLSGIVPVYMGAPDLARRLSSLVDIGHAWYIDVLDFDTPGHLVAYLSHVGSNRTLWENYGAWRGRLRESALVAQQNNTHSMFPLFPRASRAVRESMDDSRVVNLIKTGAARRSPLRRRVAAICRLCDLSYMHSLEPIIPLAPPLKAKHLSCLFATNCSCRDSTPCRNDLSSTMLHIASELTRNVTAELSTSVPGKSSKGATHQTRTAQKRTKKSAKTAAGEQNPRRRRQNRRGKHARTKRPSAAMKRRGSKRTKGSQ